MVIGLKDLRRLNNMKYMGSKNRYAEELLPIILKGRKPKQFYVEPFAGGMNIIDKVKGNRIANDLNTELIEMWKTLVYKGWKPNTYINKKTFNEIKYNRKDYEPHFLGWVGFNCSYCGIYFSDHAGKLTTKTGVKRNYQAEAKRNVLKQVENLKDVVFINKKYDEFKIPLNSIVYCDPPYKNTAKYDFDHDLFWEWVRKINRQGCKVYVSEYIAPDDFTCIWEKDAASSLSANGVTEGSKKSVEKLFTLRSK